MLLVDARGRVLQFSSAVAELIGWAAAGALPRRLPTPLHALVTEPSTRRKASCFVSLNGSRLRVDCYLLAESDSAKPQHYALHLRRDDPLVLRAANAARTLGLTLRQQQICARIADGEEYREIATALGISASTVVDHVRRIHRRLGVRSRTKLILLLEQTANGAAVVER